MSNKKPRVGPRCGRCGRALTNVVSVRVGYGPVCRAKLGMRGISPKKIRENRGIDDFIDSGGRV